jgi:hypothetical protein
LRELGRTNDEPPAAATAAAKQGAANAAAAAGGRVEEGAAAVCMTGVPLLAGAEPSGRGGKLLKSMRWRLAYSCNLLLGERSTGEGGGQRERGG